MWLALYFLKFLLTTSLFSLFPVLAHSFLLLVFISFLYHALSDWRENARRGKNYLMTLLSACLYPSFPLIFCKKKTFICTFDSNSFFKTCKTTNYSFFLWRHCYTNCITFNLNYLLIINVYVLKIPFIFNVSNSFYHLSKSGYWGVSWSRLRIKWPVWPTNSQQMYVQTPLYTQLQI